MHATCARVFRFVPRSVALTLCLALGGCYLLHERPVLAGSEPDAGPRPDGALAPLDATPPDAALPPRACAYEPRGELQATASPFAAHSPVIGWDGEQVGLVVMESDGDIPHPIITHTRLAPDLSRMPAALRLAGEESHSWGEAAWDQDVGFAVCWSSDAGGASHTAFRVRSASGEPLSPRVALGERGSACEGLARAHRRRRWGAVFRAVHEGGLVSMRFAIVDDSGAIVRAIDLDEPTDYPGRGAFLSADADSFVVGQIHAGAGLELTRYTADGVVLASRLLPRPDVTWASLASDAMGGLGVALRVGARESAGLRFVALSDEFVERGPERILVSEGRGVAHPHVSAVPDGWAVIWVEQSDRSTPATGALLAHLDHEGRALEPRRRVREGANSGYGGPSLLSHGSALYAAIAHPTDAEPLRSEQAFVQRLDCVAPAPDRCAPLDAVSSGDDCVFDAGWTWTGAACAPVVCSCLGAQCDRVSATEEECLSDHADCPTSDAHESD